MQAKRVLVIGAGWNGLHTANELIKAGYRVVVADKNSDIFGGVSGKFGVRVHAGPHYPRSTKTQSASSAFQPEDPYPTSPKMRAFPFHNLTIHS